MVEMPSEESPLLRSSSPDSAVKAHEAVYDRFNRAQKRTIVALISFAGLLPFFVSGSFVPSIPQIARDLNSTGSTINLAVSLSIFSNAIGSLIWASYSSFYGRRPIYLYSLACHSAGSLGVSLARSVPELMILRVLQAFGSSSGLSVGLAVIGDIYKLEERGTASGIFLAATLLGPALAPLAGGITTHYYSWRAMQFVLFVCALVTLLSMFLFQVETSHPGTRGIDKLREAEGRSRWVWLNPFKSLALLRSPNLMLVTLAGAFCLITDYVLLIPIAYTMGKQYGISNEAVIGALFIPAGLGNIVGAPLAGLLSDRTLVKWRERRGGVWVPEDRLRVTLIGASFLVPVSVLCCGLLTQYVPGRVGLVLNLPCLFMNGVGVDLVLSPASAYFVDILHSRSAEVTAATMAFRSVSLALVAAGILPLINLIGVAATNAISALAAWIGFLFLWSVIRYGDRMRTWVDVGYSTLRDT